MSFIDSVLADTVGVGYRAYTGNVDPWTKQEIVDQEAQNIVLAGGDPDQAQAQASADVEATLHTFTLGGGDRVGADPSQSSAFPNVPSLQALADSLNLIPSWVKWAAVGAGVLGAVWLLRPYVGLAASARS